MESPTDAPVIAFDFDGVIAQYHGFVSKEDIQEPNLEVVRTMTLLREKGCKILLYSTRGDDFLKMYCEKFSVPYDYVNHRPDKEGDNPGKPIANVYIDDRALNYHGQTAEVLLEELKNFTPHWLAS
jgi:hypothetical protein